MKSLRAALAIACALSLGTVVVAAQETSPKKKSAGDAEAQPFFAPEPSGSASTDSEAEPPPATSYTAPPPPGPIPPEALHPSETPEAPKDKTKKPREPGFGDKASVLLSLEHLFGILEQRFEEGDRGQGSSFSHQGAFPAITGARIGLYGVTRSGFTAGMSMGLWSGKLFDVDDKVSRVVTFAPRVGFVGSFERTVGYWVRAGFDWLMFDLGGQQKASHYFDVAFEAYLIWSPIAHVGVTFGPHFSTSLYARRDTRVLNHRSVGFMSGLAYEF